jgi:hypothetical protein
MNEFGNQYMYTAYSVLIFRNSQKNRFVIIPKCTIEDNMKIEKNPKL